MSSKRTSNGVLVDDRSRDQKDLQEWTMAELVALALGEIVSRYEPGTAEFYSVVLGKVIIDHPDAVRWSDVELDEWLLEGKLPEKTPEGYFVNDPERWYKDAHTWNNSELIELGQGYFGELDRRNHYILDEACERFNLPMGITWECYKEWVATKKMPEMTPNGVLVKHRDRFGTPPADWDDMSLEAWCRGWVEGPEELLQEAIQRFGGELYWNRDHLATWLSGEIPDVEPPVVQEPEPPVICESNDESPEEEPPVLELPVEEEPGCQEDDLPSADVVDEPVVESIEENCECDGSLYVVDPPVDQSSPLAVALSNQTPPEVISGADRRRFVKASSWDVKDLVAWARGEVGAGMTSTRESLCTALRAHMTHATDGWTDDAIIHYIATGEPPRGFYEGVLEIDRNRERMHPGMWPDEWLIAWAKGKISTALPLTDVEVSMRVRFSVPGTYTTEEAKEFVVSGRPADKVVFKREDLVSAPAQMLIKTLRGEVERSADVDDDEFYMACRRGLSIDPHWTDSHIVRYYRSEKAPEVTSTGVLVEDRLRDLSTPARWSWNEIKALAHGEVICDFQIDGTETIARIRRLMESDFGIHPAHWSDSEVLAFLTSGVKATTLEGNVFVNDPTREGKTAKQWRDAEIKAWLRDQIPSTSKAPDDDLWDEVYLRWRISLFWYREDAKRYVLDNITVPQLPSGIYLRDRNRDLREPKHWTKREYKAWARELIAPGTNASEEALARYAVRLFGIPRNTSTKEIKRRVASITEESVSMTVSFVTEDLKAYREGRIAAGDNPEAAAPYQGMMERCISRILRLQGEDFMQGWTELSNFFAANANGICSYDKMYTGVSHMTTTVKGMRLFQTMVTLLMNTCDPVTRQRQLASINWEVVLSDVSSETARQNILAYYNAS